MKYNILIIGKGQKAVDEAWFFLMLGCDVRLEIVTDNILYGGKDFTHIAIDEITSADK